MRKLFHTSHVSINIFSFLSLIFFSEAELKTSLLMTVAEGKKLENCE